MNKFKRFERFALKVHRALPKKYRMDIYYTYGSDEVYLDTNGDFISIGTIIVEKDFERACISLLHEYGHRIVRVENILEFNYYDHYQWCRYFKITNKRKEDECLAWIFAMQIYDNITTPFTKQTFNQWMKKCLNSYDINTKELHG